MTEVRAVLWVLFREPRRFNGPLTSKTGDQGGDEKMRKRSRRRLKDMMQGMVKAGSRAVRPEEAKKGGEGGVVFYRNM